MSELMLVTCPKCGAPMSKRTGKYGDFYGCSRYPKCTCTVGIRDIKKVLAQQTASKTDNPFKPSVYQQAVFDFIQNETGNAVVEAVAGSGKTTTIVEALKITPRSAKVLFCAFNVHIKKELESRAPSHVAVKTVHGLGFGALLHGLPVKPDVDDGKLDSIVREMLPEESDGHLRTPLSRLVSLAKNTLVDVDSAQALEQMATRYEIDLNGDSERLFALVPVAMQMSMTRLATVDYDDMIWLPIVLNLRMDTYDIVLVDECQDLNASQIELVKRTMRQPSGRIIAVGDRHQSIYGFRGADVDAIPRLITELNAKVLPLSISYRCPICAINMAQEIVPQIQAAPGAEMGLTEWATYMRMLQSVQDGDLVLCRFNAPLVKLCYTLIKRGVKVIMRGRDFGKGLVSLIDKMKATSILDLTEKLRAYRDAEIAKLEKANKTSQVESLRDRCECIFEMSDGVGDITTLKFRITSLFDDDSKTGVVASSIHRAKGDEAYRVWCLEAGAVKATQDWQIEQENNLEYVKLTRVKRGSKPGQGELIFVQTDKR